MFRNANDGILRKDAKFGEHSPNLGSRAQRRSRLFGRWLTFQPILDEYRRHAVAYSPFRNAFADCSYFARRIGKRHCRQLHSRIVSTARNHDVAKIHRGRTKTDLHFACCGLRDTAIYDSELFNSELLNLVTFHKRALSFLSRRIQIQSENDIVSDKVVSLSGISDPKVLSIDRKLAVNHNAVRIDSY